MRLLHQFLTLWDLKQSKSLFWLWIFLRVNAYIDYSNGWPNFETLWDPQRSPNLVQIHPRLVINLVYAHDKFRVWRYQKCLKWLSAVLFLPWAVRRVTCNAEIKHRVLNNMMNLLSVYHCSELMHSVWQSCSTDSLLYQRDLSVVRNKKDNPVWLS